MFLQSSNLEALGVRCKRYETESSSSFSINGMEVSGGVSFGVRYEFALPSGSVKAAFTREGLAQRFSKLFSAEYQTGDDLFDSVVFIKGKDHEGIAKLLAREDLRDVVYDIVAEGGTVVLAERRVVVELPGDLSPDQAEKVEALITRATEL